MIWRNLARKAQQKRLSTFLERDEKIEGLKSSEMLNFPKDEIIEFEKENWKEKRSFFLKLDDVIATG